MKIFKVLFLCVIFILIFSSCVDQSFVINGGILLDDDVLSSILKENEDRENSLLANDGDVFWTPSGTIWHKTPECSYIADSKTILHGTVDEARLEGKGRECSKCFLIEEDKLYNELLDNPIELGDVFFTRDGKEWHTDINCSVIFGVERIYNASIAEAKSLGKMHACSECGE